VCLVFVHTVVVRIPYCNKLSEPPFDIASKFAIELQAPREEPLPAGLFFTSAAVKNSVPSIADYFVVRP
jgi:hypothetical protein